MIFITKKGVTMNTATSVWEEEWAQLLQEEPDKKDSSFWDKQAPSFRNKGVGSEYQDDFLSLMDLRPSWDVLDVGCGSGVLALPLAEQVASVTGLDFSTGMLKMLLQYCDEAKITNIQADHGRWDDDWDTLGIGTYDIVIASRSLAVTDLRGSLAKLDRAARKQVYISAMVGEGPYDQRLIKAVGRPLKKGLSYIYIYNVLYEMGIYAKVSFITNTVWRSYQSIEDAIESKSWMFDRISAEEKQLLWDYFSSQLVPHNGRLRLPEPNIIRWAVIHWNKEDINV